MSCIPCWRPGDVIVTSDFGGPLNRACYVATNQVTTTPSVPIVNAFLSDIGDCDLCNPACGPLGVEGPCPDPAPNITHSWSGVQATIRFLQSGNACQLSTGQVSTSPRVCTDNGGSHWWAPIDDRGVENGGGTCTEQNPLPDSGSQSIITCSDEIFPGTRHWVTTTSMRNLFVDPVFPECFARGGITVGWAAEYLGPVPTGVSWFVVSAQTFGPSGECQAEIILNSPGGLTT